MDTSKRIFNVCFQITSDIESRWFSSTRKRMKSLLFTADGAIYRRIGLFHNRTQRLHPVQTEVCDTCSISWMCTGQVTIKDDMGRWYFGSYGRPGCSHIRSFNRVLFWLVCFVSWRICPSAVASMRKRLPPLSDDLLTPPKRSRRGSEESVGSPQKKCICSGQTTPRTISDPKGRDAVLTPPKLERPAGLYRGGLLKSRRGKVELIPPLPFWSKNCVQRTVEIRHSEWNP